MLFDRKLWNIELKIRKKPKIKKEKFQLSFKYAFFWIKLPIKKAGNKNKIPIATAEGKKNIPRRKREKPHSLRDLLFKKLLIITCIDKYFINHYASCRIRTCGPLLRRQLLYPAELRKHLNIISDTLSLNNLSKFFLWF